MRPLDAKRRGQFPHLEPLAPCIPPTRSFRACFRSSSSSSSSRRRVMIMEEEEEEVEVEEVVVGAVGGVMMI